MGAGRGGGLVVVQADLLCLELGSITDGLVPARRRADLAAGVTERGRGEGAGRDTGA